MALNKPMLNWLRFHKCREGFVNSEFFALVSENLRVVERFEIPIFILAEELEREERDPSYNSIAIREYIVRLLKYTSPQEQIKYTNYDDPIREFFNNRGMLPSGIPNPLQPNIRFRSLSTEVKLYLMYQIIHNRGIANNLKEICADSQHNKYFLVEGGRLYMEYGKVLSELAKDDNNNRDNLTPLETYLKQQKRYKLLAETPKLWKNISLILENFDEEAIAAKIMNKRETAMQMMLSDEQELYARQKFDQILDSLRPTPSPRRTQANRNEPTNVPPPAYDELYNFQARKTSAASSNYSPDARTTPTPTPNTPTPDARNHPMMGKTRCMYYPNCIHRDNCRHWHPEEPCKNFQNDKCPAGIHCKYIHPDCPRDRYCRDDMECNFEHPKCWPTLLRRIRARNDEENQQRPPRPASRNSSVYEEDRDRGRTPEPTRNARPRSQSRGRKQERPSNNIPPQQSTYNPPRERGRSVNGRNQGAKLPHSTKDQRCQHWPSCINGINCDYAHPTEPCGAFPNCYRGRDCPFLHWNCPQDGKCRNEHCPFEHRQQLPPRMIAYRQRFNDSRSGADSGSMKSGGTRR